jgi:hypothetical protein
MSIVPVDTKNLFRVPGTDSGRATVAESTGLEHLQQLHRKNSDPFKDKRRGTRYTLISGDIP